MDTYAGHTSTTTTAIRTRILGAVFFTVFTAVCAKVSFHLWFTPVPVTLQVLGVILSGLVLGSRWGAISQAQYLAMGAVGVPVFAGPSAGPASFVGPSGGYLLGFVVGAYAAGWVFERLESRGSPAAILGGIAGIAGVYALGAPWLGVWFRLAAMKPWDECMRGAWQLGIVPFIGVDLLKAIAASGIALGSRSGRGLLHHFRGLGC